MEQEAQAPTTSLYARLGELPAITLVVEAFVANLAADERINHFFAKSDIPALTQNLIDQICEATGGPCVYKGQTMREVHAGMEVAPDDFDALVEDLIAALDKYQVPDAEKGQLLQALAAMKPDVVDVPLLGGGATGVAGVDELPKGPVRDKVISLQQGAAQLAGAQEALSRGDKNLAEKRFSTAELLIGSKALESLAAMFREGAPPRITTPTIAVDPNAEKQPETAGSSDAEDGTTEPEAQKKRFAHLNGQLRIDGEKGGAFGWVTLEPARGKWKARKARKVVVEQRDREYSPSLTVIPVGSTASFPNFDPFFHNVFSRSPSASFDLGLYPKGQAREYTFNETGIVRLGCNLHANMRAHFVVTDAPMYTVSNRKGRFDFHRVRPGKYRLRAWTTRSQAPIEKLITVALDGDEIVVELPGDASPGPLPDKFGASRD